MAEAVGFEPTVRKKPYGNLANFWYKPLTHASKFLDLADKNYIRIAVCFNAMKLTKNKRLV